MQKTIKINGKEYKYDMEELDFNGMCYLEQNGLYIANPKSLSTIRALVSYVMKADADVAGHAIMEHRRNGGSYEDFTVLIEGLEESDFFRTEKELAEKQSK